MKLGYGTQFGFTAIWILIGLLSGPTIVATIAAVATNTGFVVPPGAAPRYAGPQGREADITEMYVTKEQSGGLISLHKSIIAPMSGPPLHIHLTEDEFFYVLKGTFKLQVGDEITDALVGSMMFVPRGVAHTFMNAGSEPGEFLVGVVPGGFEGFFVERVGKDKEAVKALAEKYNMKVVGPPLK
jgi:mannose-6-phosphate isomerase-like protein (cupin superfamily)